MRRINAQMQHDIDIMKKRLHNLRVCQQSLGFLKDVPEDGEQKGKIQPHADQSVYSFLPEAKSSCVTGTDDGAGRYLARRQALR